MKTSAKAKETSRDFIVYFDVSGRNFSHLLSYIRVFHALVKMTENCNFCWYGFHQPKFLIKSTISHEIACLYVHEELSVL